MPIIQTCDCPQQLSAYDSDDYLERAKEDLEAYNDMDAMRAIANALIAICERLDKLAASSRGMVRG